MISSDIAVQYILSNMGETSPRTSSRVGNYHSSWKSFSMGKDLSILERRYYSTRELAGLLRTTEATIKRWSDAGQLKCFKTPGGHRRYTPKRVVEFLRAYRYEILSPDPKILLDARKKG